MEPGSEKTEMKSLTSCLTKLNHDGFIENFMVNEYGLRALDSEKYYTPEEVKIVNYYRFEGESDPGDMSILYVIETNDGLKGTLTDAFGTYGDENVMRFTAAVEDVVMKKIPKPDNPDKDRVNDSVQAGQKNILPG